jgi:hypothetical protein
MMLLRALAALALALLAQPASALTISFQNGFDGYVGAEHASYNFAGAGYRNRIRIDFANPSHPEDRYSWLVFADIVGEDAIPAGATVLSARLEGWVTNPFGSASLTWLFDEIANRPSGYGTSILAGAGSFYDAALVSASHPGGCVSTSLCDPAVPIAWDVTAIVQAWVDGAANHGFLLLPETTNGGDLAHTGAVPASLRPRLVIEYAPSSVSVPEPAGLGLLALAALRAAARARESQEPRSRRRPGTPSR